MKKDYGKLVNNTYQGEVGGEAFFIALGEQFENSEQSYKMRVLARLEFETAQQLKPLVEQLGYSTKPDTGALRRGAAEAEKYSGIPWTEIMISLQKEIIKFVKEYRGLEEMSPDRDILILRYLTRHEEVLQEFTELEIAGRGKQSLEPVLALLAQLPSR